MLPTALDSQRVLSFKQWCSLNGISVPTGRRLLDAGNGPEIIRLSPRRIGVTVAANRAWQEARTQAPTAKKLSFDRDDKAAAHTAPIATQDPST